MDLDSFFGFEKTVRELMILLNYGDEDLRLVIMILHVLGGAVFFVVNVLTSPFKLLRPLFSWLGAIWIQQTFMALIFVGLAFFITKGEMSMSRIFYLYLALLLLTVLIHADLSRLMPEKKKKQLAQQQDHRGRIDFSFRIKGEIPTNIR